MIGGLKFKEGDAEQPLLGPRMLSMRVNVLKLKNASETASVLISLIISESLKLKICRKFLTAYVNIFCSNWILFFKLVTRTKIQAFTDVIAGLNSRLHKMFRMCFRRTPTYLKVPR